MKLQCLHGGDETFVVWVWSYWILQASFSDIETPERDELPGSVVSSAKILAKNGHCLHYSDYTRIISLRLEKVSFPILFSSVRKVNLCKYMILTSRQNILLTWLYISVLICHIVLSRKFSTIYIPEFFYENYLSMKEMVSSWSEKYVEIINYWIQ